MPKVIEKEDPKDATFMRKVVDFITVKKLIDDKTKEKATIQSELSNIVDEFGEPDEKGHLWIRLPHEVDGYTSLQRQRKVSQTLDEDTAEELLKSKGLYDRCYEERPVLKEDEVMACLYDGLLTEEDIDKMFPKKVTWAFIASKA